MGSGPDGDDFAAVIVPAGVAQIVRALEFTAVGAFLIGLDAQRVVAAVVRLAGFRWDADANGAADPCGPGDREAMRL